GLNDTPGEQGDGIDLKAGLQNVTVRNNVIDTTHANAGDDGGSGIVISGTFNSAFENYLIEGNRFYRTWGRGMQLGNLHGVIIRDNVVALAGRGPTAQTGIDFSGDRTQGFTNDNVQIYNNTIYGSAGCGLMLGIINGPITVRNNLIAANGSSGDSWDVTG